MKQLFFFAVIFVLITTGCSNDASTGIVNAPVDERSELNTGSNFTPNILPPSDNGPTVTVTASDTIVWPPNKKWKTVTFSGTLSDYTVATYALTDQYGKISYAGSLSGATYSVPLKLKAERKGKDKDGRTYTFTVTAVGSLTVTVSVDVVVPHDKKKSGGKDDGDDDDDDCDDGGGDD
ncbi:MAG: hypothetical protein HYV29_00105 [Ignavibacteriales bacterium]|nr:hypothetical protein [Ignavibacteriales bacterium]